MKVLITGGSGFIGSHLTERLLGRGDEVCVIDNYSTGRRDNLAPHPNLTLIEGGIENEALVSECFGDFRPDVLVHAAASYKDPHNYIADAQTNVLGTATVVHQAKRANIRRLIYLQTALCYGDPRQTPVTVDHPLNPGKSSYAISKTAAEMYIMLSGLDYISFRLANVYGPRNFSGPLPTFYHRLSQGKSCFVADARRDFVFVEDMIQILEKGIDGIGSQGVYHISSGKDISIKELFDAVVRAMNITLEKEAEIKPRSPDDVPTILLDPSKTMRDFGILPRTPLHQGVQKAVRYYAEHGVSETYTHLRVHPKKGS